MALPTVGTHAPWPPGITTQDGRPVDLADHRGQHVLLYFYPKDDTPGCTVEACNFRDHAAEIDAVIYGVSLDDAVSHQAFREKYQLPFDLLVDANGALARAYGALADDAQYPTRMSALIGRDGRIAAVWPKVKADAHWHEVQQALAR